MSENRRERFVLRYTLMFAFVAAAVLAVFGLHDRSFIFGKDGAAQHAPALIYLGEYIRDGLSGNGWKMIDFSLGQGFDVLATLTYYSFAEPLAWLAALFAPERIELSYGLLMFARFYLAGLFTCMLAKKCGAEAWTVPAAGVMYAFCGFALGGGMKHLNFGVGIMYLPLLLLGVERVFAQKKWGLYVAAVALQLVSNFYFAYMNTVIAILYIVVRLAIRLKMRESVKRCARDGFALLGGYLLGAALTAVVMLPVAVAYLNSSRPVDVSAVNAALYPLEYYVQVLASFFQYPKAVGYWAALGFVPLAMFALAALFVKGRRGNGAVCIMLVLCMAMLCSPVAGRVMNGMGYVSNRWSYALAMFAAIGTALGLKPLLDWNWKQMLLLCAAAIAYAAVSAYVLRTINAAMAAVVFAGTALVLAVYAAREIGWLTAKRMRAIVLMLTAGSVAVYSVLFFLPRSAGAISGYWYCGEAADSSKMAASVFEDTADDDFYRVTGSADAAPSETGQYDAYASALDYHGTAYYWSIIPEEISEHYADLWSNAQPASYVADGLGGDSGLNLLASVKYILAAENDAVPLGYEAVKDGSQYIVMENRYALPIGYTFDSWMSVDDYERLSAVEKRDALLHTAVVDSAVEGLAEDNSEPTVKKLNAFIQEVVLEDGLTIRCNVPEEGEIFVAVAAPEMAGSGSYFDIVGPVGRNRAHVNDKSTNYAYPQQGVVIPMGVCEAGETEFVFEMKSGFDIDGITIWHRPMGDYVSAAEKLGEDVLENVEVGANFVRGTIALNETKWLQLSIPYNEGWTAKVDGEPAELSRSGGMYMGLALEAGEHEIELNYETPHLKLGVIISTLAAAACAALAAAGRKRK